MKHCIDYYNNLADAPKWFTSRKKVKNDAAWDLVQMQFWSRMWFFLGWAMFFWRGRVK